MKTSGLGDYNIGAKSQIADEKQLLRKSSARFSAARRQGAHLAQLQARSGGRE